jgi:hypothetical protein
MKWRHYAKKIKPGIVLLVLVLAHLRAPMICGRPADGKKYASLAQGQCVLKIRVPKGSRNVTNAELVMGRALSRNSKMM